MKIYFEKQLSNTFSHKYIFFSFTFVPNKCENEMNLFSINIFLKDVEMRTQKDLFLFPTPSTMILSPYLELWDICNLKPSSSILWRYLLEKNPIYTYNLNFFVSKLHQTIFIRNFFLSSFQILFYDILTLLLLCPKKHNTHSKWIHNVKILQNKTYRSTKCVFWFRDWIYMYIT